MNRKVVYARFHQPLFVKGIGTIGVELPQLRTNLVVYSRTASSNTLTDLDMVLTSDGLEVKFSCPQGRKEIFVPLANIVNADVEMETPKPVKKEK